MRKRGFTLIELLIVVAIIAILAAIAVPNFLEAQTRSKVSRAKADMRSLATALEAYRVDNTSYPVGKLRDYPLAWRLSYLTTPVAYITSTPMDPFHVLGSHTDYVARDAYDYFDEESAQPSHPWGWTLFGRRWRLTSAGPDLIASWATMPPYDASNGTKSVGDIVILQGSSDYNYLPLLLEYSP
jgi:type II secretion system protein G